MLIDFIVSHLIKFKFLDGFRMYLGGACLVLTGLGLIMNQVATGVYDHDTFEKGLVLIGAGLGVSGLAGKQDKIAAEAGRMR